MLDFDALALSMLAMLAIPLAAVIGIAVFMYGYSAGWKIFRKMIISDNQKWGS